jgi:hypothetical protein
MAPIAAGSGCGHMAVCLGRPRLARPIALLASLVFCPGESGRTMSGSFSEMCHVFQCVAPQCGKVFYATFRKIRNADAVVCPKCKAALDIRELKRSGEIGACSAR